VGFVVDKMAPGQVFSEYFGFPCQSHFIPTTSPSSQSPGTGTIGQYMAAVPRGHPIWTPLPTIRIKKKIIGISFLSGTRKISTEQILVPFAVLQMPSPKKESENMGFIYLHAPFVGLKVL
jgi:hypothetical protein